eukprot:gene3998-4967_t
MSAPQSMPVPEGYSVLSEGKARILQKQENEVFYNKAQSDPDEVALTYTTKDDLLQICVNVNETLRLHVSQNALPTPVNPDAATSELPKFTPLRILEGLAASGLRAMRYAAELEDVGVVVANDMDPKAVEAIRRNVEFAGPAAAKVVPMEADARLIMLQLEK